MCGRNTLYVSQRKIEDRYGVELDSFAKSYNIAPNNKQTIIRKGSSRTGKFAKWSFKPEWADEDQKKEWENKSVINARLETVTDNKLFKKSFNKRKCLVPSTGFYEWKDEGKPTKTPYHIKPGNREIFSFAGFYQDQTFCIITKPSRKTKMKKIHDRTPVIIPNSREYQYLHDEISIDELRKTQDYKINTKKVSTKVNNPENDSKDILEIETKQSSLSNIQKELRKL